MLTLQAADIKKNEALLRKVINLAHTVTYSSAWGAVTKTLGNPDRLISKL